MKPLLALLVCCLITVAPRAEVRGQCVNRIAKLTRQAGAVVVAEVTDAGRAPGFWSGIIAAQQTVKYRVDNVLKGNLKGSSFTVDYYVVHGSRLSEKNTPELNRALFRVGNKVLLFLHSRTVQLPNGTERLVVTAVSDQECAVLLSSTAAIKAVRNAAAR